MAWIDLTPDLTKQAIKDFKAGHVLIFEFEGSKTYFKVMRNYKGKIWVKETKLYTIEEARKIRPL